MIRELFDQLLAERIKKTQSVLCHKAQEYAHNNDRLYNFRVAARLRDSTLPSVLWGFALKHVVSVQDLVDGKIENTEAMASEKIGDLINYLILLEAALKEEREFLC